VISGARSALSGTTVRSGNRTGASLSKRFVNVDEPLQL